MQLYQDIMTMMEFYRNSALEHYQCPLSPPSSFLKVGGSAPVGEVGVHRATAQFDTQLLHTHCFIYFLNNSLTRYISCGTEEVRKFVKLTLRTSRQSNYNNNLWNTYSIILRGDRSHNTLCSRNLHSDPLKHNESRLYSKAT